MTISFVIPVKQELKQHPRERSNWCCTLLGLTCVSTARSVSRHESKWCSLQVPALRKHLAATLKSEEEYLAGANAQEHHPAREAARPVTPPPQEQQLRQAPVSPYSVQTVRSQLWSGSCHSGGTIKGYWCEGPCWHESCTLSRQRASRSPLRQCATEA